MFLFSDFAGQVIDAGSLEMVVETKSRQELMSPPTKIVSAILKRGGTCDALDDLPRLRGCLRTYIAVVLAQMYGDLGNKLVSLHHLLILFSPC